jgi:hypothetical protein
VHLSAQAEQSPSPCCCYQAACANTHGVRLSAPRGSTCDLHLRSPCCTTGEASSTACPRLGCMRQPAPALPCCCHTCNAASFHHPFRPHTSVMTDHLRLPQKVSEAGAHQEHALVKAAFPSLKSDTMLGIPNPEMAASPATMTAPRQNTMMEVRPKRRTCMRRWHHTIQLVQAVRSVQLLVADSGQDG